MDPSSIASLGTTDRLTQDDLKYMAAECKEPHDDGTRCLPSWNGFVYLCNYRFVKYMAAECKEPHDDGTRCLPSWNGFVYLCNYRFVKSFKEGRIKV